MILKSLQKQRGRRVRPGRISQPRIIQQRDPYRIYNPSKNVEADVTIVSTIMKADGIGRQGIGMCEAIKDKIRVNGIPTRPPTPDDVDPETLRLLTTYEGLAPVVVLQDILKFGPNQPWLKVPKNIPVKIAYSMLESSLIPKEWAGILNTSFDLVAVPDEYTLQVYKKSGVVTPIVVLPLGIYIEELLSTPLKKERNPIFTVGLNAGFWKRKNFEGTVKSFLNAFPTEKDVKLVIHGRFGEHRAQVFKLGSLDPRISISEGCISDKAYLDWFSQLDAYIFLSRGEGFSITPREAMALGLPVVLSDNTTHGTICKTGLVCPVACPREQPAHYEVFSEVIGTQFDPDIEISTKHLRDIYDNYDQHILLAQSRRDWVSQFTWKNLSEAYVTLVKPNKVIISDNPKIEAETRTLYVSDKLAKKYKQFVI